MTTVKYNMWVNTDGGWAIVDSDMTDEQVKEQIKFERDTMGFKNFYNVLLQHINGQKVVGHLRKNLANGNVREFVFTIKPEYIDVYNIICIDIETGEQLQHGKQDMTLEECIKVENKLFAGGCDTANISAYKYATLSGLKVDAVHIGKHFVYVTIVRTIKVK